MWGTDALALVLLQRSVTHCVQPGEYVVPALVLWPGDAVS